VGNAETVILLARHASESSGDEQEAARESLYSLDAPNTDQTVLSSIMQVEPEPRLELIMSIDDRRILTGTEILLETAQNPNARTRVESVRVLANVADPNYLSQMLELLADARNATERAEIENGIVAIALRKPADSNRAQEVLNRYDATQNTDTRASLIQILGNIGAEESLVTIQNAIESNNSDIKVAAIRALSAWPNSEPASDLLQVVQNTNSNTQKILALRGYVQLLSFDSESAGIVEKYQQAMDLAPNVNERRAVLSGLADVKSLAALELAANYLENSSLKNEAEVAVVQISQDIYDEYPEQTNDILEQVIRSTQNESLTEEAKEVLAQLN
jgi:HEAT repeat protein